ncbi:MAG: hypothetical protein ABSB69_09275 [Solirubrobacteraceae bacterium]
MEHLTALGAQTGQGYVISRPLPVQELTAQLSAAFGINAGGEAGAYAATAPVAGFAA